MRLFAFWQIMGEDIRIMDYVFSEMTGELTATQKVKRRVVQDKYKDVIDTLYPSDTLAF